MSSPSESRNDQCIGNLCVDKIQSPRIGELCVDKTQSPQICNLCVEKKSPAHVAPEQIPGGRNFLLEKLSLVDFPIRKVRAREFVRARRGRGFFSTQRLQICADWVLSTQSSPAACAFGGWQEFGWLRLGSGFRYTEIADSWRLDCIYTEIADALVVAGLARR